MSRGQNTLPPLAWLRSFEAAARHQNFTSAAQELGMTQAALSKQIRALEARLGEPLFIRKARTLELTRKAKQYSPLVSAALAQLSSDTHAVFGARKENELSIKAIQSFAQNWLTPRLPRFMALHPEIELKIHSVVWADDDPLGDCDFDFRYGYDLWRDCHVDRLTYETITPLIRPEDAGAISTPADLQKFPLIHVAGYHEGWEVWFRHHGLTPEGRAIQVDNSNFSYALTKAGLGVSLGRSSLCSAELQSGELVAPFETAIPIDEGFFLLSRPDENNPAKNAFREWVLNEINIL